MSPTDPESQTGNKRRFPSRAFVLVLVGVILGGLLLLISGQRSSSLSPGMWNLLVLKHHFPALKMYASEHGGRYPFALGELEPDYLPPGASQTEAYRDPDSKRRYDWLYIPGLGETSPADWIVMASPSGQSANRADQAQRIILRNDGSVRFVDEAAYQRELKKQLKMRAKGRAGEEPEKAK